MHNQLPSSNFKKNVHVDWIDVNWVYNVSLWILISKGVTAKTAVLPNGIICKLTDVFILVTYSWQWFNLCRKLDSSITSLSRFTLTISPRHNTHHLPSLSLLVTTHTCLKFTVSLAHTAVPITTHSYTTFTVSLRHKTHLPCHHCISES